VEGFCEHRNKPLDSIKFEGNFLVSAQLAASQEEFNSMDLISYECKEISNGVFQLA
jgi:hypothetical protein